MLLIDLLAEDLTYTIVLLVWTIGLATALVVLLKQRRQSRANRRKMLFIHVGLAFWMVLAVGTACETSFALFVDQSDTFNTTNVSKRWLRLHHDNEKQPPLGNRDIESFTKFPPPGKKRICFVGDSFTAGHGVKHMRDRFADRIRARLEEKQPGRYVVANLGDPGLETSMIEAIVHSLLLDGNEMSMVVYVLCLNDIEGFPQVVDGKDNWDTPTKKALAGVYVAAPRFFLFRDTYFFNWLYYRYLQLRSPASNSYFDALAESYRTTQWDLMSRKILQMRDECREKNVEFRMAIFPFLHSLGPDYPFLETHRKLVAFCQAHEIRVLDLEPVFRAHAEEHLTVNPFDAHPNERAHAIAAEAMEQKLLNDLFEPAGK